MAEREGFEPSVEVLPLRRFSKPLPSATRPPLHWSQLYTGSGTVVMQTSQNAEGLHLWHNIAAILSQDAQKGRSTRPQRAERRGVRFGTVSHCAMRERCWRTFSASCYAGFPMICDRGRCPPTLRLAARLLRFAPSMWRAICTVSAVQPHSKCARDPPRRARIEKRMACFFN